MTTDAINPDPEGRERALRRAAMPEALLIPIAAVSLNAISNHVGRDCVSLPNTRGDNAVVVRNEAGPAKSHLKVWQHPNSEILNAECQLWVRPRYSGYRTAYRKAFPEEDLGQKVIHHIMNRRYALLHGFEYVRVVPISRSGNSSSGFTETWGVDLTKDGTLRSRKGLSQIAYADLAHLMSMLDMSIGGGVMESVRRAADLLKPAGQAPGPGASD